MEEKRVDNRITKKYYKIREAADIIGVPQSTLRYWEKEFNSLNPRRSTHNQRYYTHADLEVLQIIYFLLYTKGLKVEAAKEQLRINKKNISKKLNVINKLKEVKEELIHLKSALDLRGNKLGII